MSNATEPLLTSSEVAAAANVTRHTVSRWVRQGDLPAVRLPGGRSLRFRRSDVDAMLAPTTGDAA